MKSQIGVMTLAAIFSGGFCLPGADRQPAPKADVTPSAHERAVAAIREQFKFDDIRVFTRTNTNITPGHLITFEEFTRDGQTNLLRITVTKDGVLQHRSHNFYHNGADVGRHIWSGKNTIISSVPGAPYSLNFVLDSSNQPVAASILITNYVILDSFTCTSGVFYPEDSSRIRESNRRVKDVLPR